MNTSLEKITEEQAQAILDMLVKRAGFDELLVVPSHFAENIYDVCLIRGHGNNIVKYYVCTRLGPMRLSPVYSTIQLQSNIWLQTSKKTADSSLTAQDTLKQFLDMVNKNNIDLVVFNGGNGYAVFLHAETSLEELLVQLDLEV